MWNLHILPDHGKVVPPCFRLSDVTKSCLDIILWLDSCPYLYLNSAPPPPTPPQKKKHHLKNDAWKTKQPFSFKMVPPFKMTFVLFSLGFPTRKRWGNGLKSQVSCQGWSHHHLRGVRVFGHRPRRWTKVQEAPEPSYTGSDIGPHIHEQWNKNPGWLLII